ncbi:MAG: NAD(P)/FAD-dependent oxidoreductase, partial [Oscillibacter sp.]
YRGKAVAVLGYSETARREADFLREIGCLVSYFDHPRQCAILGEAAVEAVTCDGKTIPAAGVFLLRPTVAPTDLFPGLAVENGYITVDRRMATSLPGLFAAGDCTGGPLQIAKATGEGLIAGQSAAAWVDNRKKK